MLARYQRNMRRITVNGGQYEFKKGGRQCVNEMLYRKQNATTELYGAVT